VNNVAFLSKDNSVLVGKVIRFQRPEIHDPKPLLVNSVLSSGLNNTPCLDRWSYS